MKPEFSMLEQASAHADYIFTSALIAGLLGNLFGHGDNDQDAEVIAAHKLVMEALSDADRTEIVKAVTGKNWRDQLTVEELEAINEEVELRKMGPRRN